MRTFAAVSAALLLSSAAAEVYMKEKFDKGASCARGARGGARGRGDVRATLAWKIGRSRDADGTRRPRAQAGRTAG